ncbi:MAG: hypothetical protein WBE65_14310, partial [Steroidobacteraceae bacterium]
MPEGAAGVAMFRGAVRCRRDPAGALEITLEGLAGGEAEGAGEPVTVAFSGATDPGLPEALEDAVVGRLGPGRYRIAAGAREWLIGAAAVH